MTWPASLTKGPARGRKAMLPMGHLFRMPLRWDDHIRREHEQVLTHSKGMSRRQGVPREEIEDGTTPTGGCLGKKLKMGQRRQAAPPSEGKTMRTERAAGDGAYHGGGGAATAGNACSHSDAAATTECARSRPRRNHLMRRHHGIQDR